TFVVGNAADFEITKATQAITFGALAGKTYGDAPFTVSATGGPSGSPVTFTTGASDDCTNSGATITITGAGSCTVTAHQAGSPNYEAADPVDQTFSIAKATLHVDAKPDSKVYKHDNPD